ncbi:uncharacterized protein LOC106373824 isoform X2 [Brassica napus]|uniref:uncharacterized protein LOC106373824 isoform X2 n=1 Tax=Brassica napus TaxID=3708 RepID=UPI002078F4D1|nr:uncharacterized protein LOC106373824 isoform X2 [Brassica napus]
MFPFARAPTVVLWDTFDCPIIPDDDFTEVFLITKSALEEKGIITGVYGSVEFRAFVGDMDECPGFPVFWIDKAKGKDDRLWSIITFLLAQANYYSSSTTFLNLLLVVGDISEHEEFQRTIRLLNSRRKFNVLLAQPPPQNASSSSGEELFDKDWLCSRLAAGEQLINKLGIGKTFEPPLKHIPSHQVALTSHQVALPSHQVATKLSFAKPLCLSKHMAERARTCVFWDTVAYPLPAGLHSDDVLQNIEDALSERGYCGRVSVTAFLDDHPSPPGFTGCNVSYLKDGEPLGKDWLCSSLSAGDKLLSQIEQKLIMSTIVKPLTPWQERYKAATTVVFWDLVDCPVPVGRTAVLASQIIRSAFEKMSYRGTVTIHAFGEVSNLDPLVSELRDVECHDENTPTPSGVFLEDTNPSGIVFHHTPTAHKDARREMMRDELRVWALGNDAPANVMAILRDTSDDKIFAGYLNVLRSINYNVVIAQPQNALGQLFDMEWLCARLGDRFLPRTRNLASYDRYRFR